MMTPKKRLVTAPMAIDRESAIKILNENRIEKLPLVDEKGHLKGLMTIKDILKTIDHPFSNKDSFGRLRVAAAVGAGDKEFERAKALVEENVDALVVDTAHGHSL